MTEKNPFFGATFAERKAIRLATQKQSTKAVAADELEVEDKSVTPRKAPAKTKKKG